LELIQIDIHTSKICTFKRKTWWIEHNKNCKFQFSDFFAQTIHTSLILYEGKKNLQSAVKIDDQQRIPACRGRSYVDRPAGRDVRQAGGVRSSSQTSTHMHTSKSGIMGDQIKGGSMLV
jgi:hypothetical protein